MHTNTKNETLETARSILTPGTRIYTNVVHADNSGVIIRAYIARTDKDGTPYIESISRLVSQVTGLRFSYALIGVILEGTLQDMVDALSRALYPDMADALVNVNLLSL